MHEVKLTVQVNHLDGLWDRRETTNYELGPSTQKSLGMLGFLQRDLAKPLQTRIKKCFSTMQT